MRVTFDATPGLKDICTEANIIVSYHDIRMQLGRGLDKLFRAGGGAARSVRKCGANDTAPVVL